MESISPLAVYGLEVAFGFAMGAAAYLAVRLIRGNLDSKKCARWAEYLERVGGKSRRDAQLLVAALTQVNRLPQMTIDKVAELLATRKG